MKAHADVRKRHADVMKAHADVRERHDEDRKRHANVKQDSSMNAHATPMGSRGWALADGLSRMGSRGPQ